jgi:uncharacterized protein (DUF1786 family)
MKAQADSLLKAPQTLIRGSFYDTDQQRYWALPIGSSPAFYCVNIGNGILWALVDEKQDHGCFRAPQFQNGPEKLQDYIIRLADGKLGFDEVFEDGGHVQYIKEVPVWTGSLDNGYSPKRGCLKSFHPRNKARNLKELHFAAPSKYDAFRLFWASCGIP